MSKYSRKYSAEGEKKALYYMEDWRKQQKSPFTYGMSLLNLKQLWMQTISKHFC